MFAAVNYYDYCDYDFLLLSHGLVVGIKVKFCCITATYKVFTGLIHAAMLGSSCYSYFTDKGISLEPLS